MITLDFETEEIIGNPTINPPKPVGLAIKEDDNNPVYLTDLQEMYNAYGQSVNSDNDLLFHNAPFDTEVAKCHLGLNPPLWHRIHDTTFLVYMANPYASSFALKHCPRRHTGRLRTLSE